MSTKRFTLILLYCVVVLIAHIDGAAVHIAHTEKLSDAELSQDVTTQVYANVGNSTNASTLSGGTSERVLRADCQEIKETGRCFALFQRYAFNAKTLACEEFIYGGCGGNRNNFETKEECERHCLPDVLLTTTTTTTAMAEVQPAQAVHGMRAQQPQ